MRFLHTADWHLGRLFHARSLIEDQSHVLDQFVALVRDLRPDAVLIAGDVYDRAVPPPEAVALLDDVLARIVVDAGVPVVMIAGNHDSAQR
ncbi:MAG: exonuclease sbcCD subunit D, partial [Burkholderiaceae bacterium]